MQFSGNSVQKRVNSVQKRVNSVQRKTSQIANQMRALDVATKFENLRAKQWPAFQVGFLSPTMQQLKNSSNNENTVKSTTNSTIP